MVKKYCKLLLSNNRTCLLKVVGVVKFRPEEAEYAQKRKDKRRYDYQYHVEGRAPMKVNGKRSLESVYHLHNVAHMRQFFVHCPR